MSSHTTHHDCDAVAHGFRLSATLPRRAGGVAAATTALAAALYILGPFSDLSARQLAAGPHSTETGSDHKPLVLARTGRSWGDGSKHAEPKPEPWLAVLAKTDPLRRR
jgi:hypothetical protein